jgi:hypothetical protein
MKLTTVTTGLLLGVVLAAPAHGAGGIGEAVVSIYYGPTCKKQFGSTNCLTDRVGGVTVAVVTYPGLKRLGRGTSGRGGMVEFADTLPFSLAFIFEGRVHGHLYRGRWRMTHLQPLSGQVLPLDLLLCPSGAWIATFLSVADSCSQRGRGVIGSGAARGTA